MLKLYLFIYFKYLHLSLNNKMFFSFYAAVGLSCEDNTACRTMANGECRQGTCACKDDFFLDSGNSSNCISREYAFYCSII